MVVDKARFTWRDVEDGERKHAQMGGRSLAEHVAKLIADGKRRGEKGKH